MISKTWLAFSLLGLAPAAFGSGIDLAPKSLQANPNLEMTVITEMTLEGKDVPPPTPQHPVYYVTDSAGFRQVGDAIPEKALTETDMAELMGKALAMRNYQPAQAPAHPPSLLIVYTWGSHNRIDHIDWTGIGAGTSPTSQTAILKNLLERATLVGGDKFAVQLYHALQQLDDLGRAQPKHPASAMPTGSVLGSMGAAGGGGGGRGQPRMNFSPGDTGAPLSSNALSGMNPVEQFRNIDQTHAALMAQAADDIYFVVASAYDYQFALQHKSLLLWRTRMTVDATGGVTQESSMPSLVLTAGPYFGKDMAEADYLRKPSLGRVILGTPEVIGTSPLAVPALAAPAK